MENARKEAVSDRVRLVTGDMRALPLADRSVDVVLSSLAIHNVQGEAGRTRAIAEIARVLKPGGVVVIQDFQNVQRYAAELRSNGFSVEQVSGLQFRIFPPARFVVARRPMRPS